MFNFLVTYNMLNCAGNYILMNEFLKVFFRTIILLRRITHTHLVYIGKSS